MDISWWLMIGLLGAVMGNLATSPLYRWPRKVALTREKPYCDSCFTPLTPRDLFPILSWWLNRGKCRSCHAAIPAIYMLMELSYCVLFISLAQRYSMGENFLILAFGLGAALLFSALLWQSNFWGWPAWYGVFVGGILWRMQQEFSLSGVLDSLMISGTVALFIWHRTGQHAQEPLVRYRALLLPAILVWIPLANWPLFGLSWGVLAGLCWLALTNFAADKRPLAFAISGVFALLSWLLGLTDLAFTL